jgi:Raf kinase inhibitor-like YbhB/YbcL family protein
MKNLRLSFLACSLLAAFSFSANAEGLRVTSSSFADGGTMPKINAGEGAGCGNGKGISPQVAWSSLPAGTKSIAVFIFDPDGAKGLGVSHWVVYNVAAERGEIEEGEAQADALGITVGKNVAGAPVYRGMCPPAGDLPHHYAMTVVATDVTPGTLSPGLSRDELQVALKGHALGGMSVVGLYGQ